METKAKCILAMVAMCLLITPAFSQGGERDGRGNPGSNMGPGQGNAMMPGPDGMSFGHGADFEKGQAVDALRFKGCNTDPWTYIKPGDGQHDGAAFGFGSPNEQAPHRSIMGPDHPQVPPKKSMMEERYHHRVHKGALKPLKPDDLPHLPPMKSIMGHGR